VPTPSPFLLSRKPDGKKPSAAPAPPRVQGYVYFVRLWSFCRRFQWLLLAMGAIVALAWYLRARDPHFSSAYMDESIYILYGRMFLAHHFEAPLDHPLNYSFGWYLWPVLAAWADRVAGLVGVRELAAAMGTIIVVSIYAFAKRVFSPAVALASALVFALLGPAVLVSRIATRDIGSLFFFAIGLWLFVRAWQQIEGRKWPAWLASAFFMFAAFLCKYLVAIYFPFFVLILLRKGRHAILGYVLPLGILCATYGLYYRRALISLWHYGQNYGSLRASSTEAWQIYFTHRWDFWILVLFALAAWFSAGELERGRWKLALLSLGAAILPLFQIVSRADYDYWKHINYSFLFLVPLAMHGLLFLLRRIAPAASYKLTAVVIVICLAVGFGWIGNSWHIDQFVFWPNTEPIAAYFQGRLASSTRLLVDDTVLRYYCSPPLHQQQITDPFFFRYGSVSGAAAYSAAVRDGLFDYIALDGGIGDDAKQMAMSIAPELSTRYILRVSMPDPTLGQRIQIYERRDPPAAGLPPAASQIEIISPVPGAIVQTDRKATTLHARVRGIAPGDYVLADVFTNRWYRQGTKLRPGAPDGDLSATVYLAGEGQEQCHHIVRVRLFDAAGHLVNSALSFNVVRANPDGTAPVCR
jgi:hypothetical protein